MKHKHTHLQKFIQTETRKKSQLFSHKHTTRTPYMHTYIHAFLDNITKSVKQVRGQKAILLNHDIKVSSYQLKQSRYNCTIHEFKNVYIYIV